MNLLDRLKTCRTLEQALILLLPDEQEFLPSTSLGEGENIDLSIFEGDLHRRFRKMVSAFPVLNEEWERRILPATLLPYPTGRSGDAGFLYSLKLGTLLLQQWGGENLSTYLPMEVTPFPPGLHTAQTLGVALMMFQPDEEEEKTNLTFGPNDRLDLGIFRKESEPRRKFEKMIGGNPLLRREWDKNVITVSDFFHDPKRDKNGNPDIVTAEEFGSAYRLIPEYKDAAAAYLITGIEILKWVELDQRTWIDAKALQIKSAKKVLGGQGEDDLTSIPALWFHVFAQQTGLRQILGETLYRYLLNGGFEKNDRVSYRELAELAEMEDFEKGFFTKMFYGLPPEKRKTVQEILQQIQESTNYFEYEYVRGETAWNVYLYVDTMTPFVEIQIGQEGLQPAVIRAFAADGAAKPLAPFVVENPPNILPGVLKQIVFSIKQFLAKDKKFEKEKQSLERLIQI